MDEVELRKHLLNQLERVTARLPNGLLYRLVEDARFFNEVNMGKRQSRRFARAQQARRHQGSG